MSRRRPSGPELLRGLVSKVYPSRDPTDVAAIRLFGHWDRTLPSRLVKNARPIRLRDGTLVVHVATSTWAQELSLLKGQLLTRLQQGVPDVPLRELLIRVGPLPDRPLTRRDRPTASRPAIRAVELPEELARALSRLDDNDLREAIARAASTSLAVPAADASRKRVDEPQGE